MQHNCSNTTQHWQHIHQQRAINFIVCDRTRWLTLPSTTTNTTTTIIITITITITTITTTTTAAIKMIQDTRPKDFRMCNGDGRPEWERGRGGGGRAGWMEQKIKENKNPFRKQEEKRTSWKKEKTTVSEGKRQISKREIDIWNESQGVRGGEGGEGGGKNKEEEGRTRRKEKEGRRQEGGKRRKRRRRIEKSRQADSMWLPPVSSPPQEGGAPDYTLNAWVSTTSRWSKARLAGPDITVM